MGQVGPMLEVAQRYAAAGLSVIPVRADGSKAPKLSGWREYSDRLPTEAELAKWFSADEPGGLGVVPGPASGNLVVLDFECREGRPAFAEWFDKLPEALRAEVLKCPVVRTPSGGRHVWVRLPEPTDGGRLARYANGKTKIEIRGQGHQVLAPGCPPECHESGATYEFESPGWLAPEAPNGAVTEFEIWSSLLAVACDCNEFAAPTRDSPWESRKGNSGVSADAPGTDFNRRGSWAETGLPEAGWEWERRSGDDRGLLRRPGKERGASASVGMVTSRENGWPLFYCWSTSVPEFAAEQPYTRFAVFAILRHGGDFSAAAKDLAARGYGSRQPDVEFPSGATPGAPGGASAPSDRFFKWMSELKVRENNDKWLWHGYVSRGGVTMLSALWKAGKSTLLSHLLRAFDGRTEQFLGLPIAPARVLYVSEEHEELWAERRDDLNIGDHVGMKCRPFRGRPSPAEWAQFIGQVARTVRENRFDLVVFDTISKLWPVREENDAGQVEEALMPVWAITDAGAGLVLVHHNRKSDGKEFTGSRGSGGLPAFCETLVEFRRASDESKDRKRVLTGGGRYRETPDKLLIELLPSGYVAHGDPDDMTPDQKVKWGVGSQKAEDWMEAVARIMPDDLMRAMTYGEIQGKLKAEVGHGARREDLLNWLAARVEEGNYQRIGNGTKTSPYRWAKRDTTVAECEAGVA